MDTRLHPLQRETGGLTRRPIVVALGSNVGDRTSHLRFATSRLQDVLTNLLVSPFIETVPEGVPPQPLFLNGAALGWSADEPGHLLEALLTIEHERGRERLSVGAPRTLDLDLILVGNLVLEWPGLSLPHPRFRDRRFVLEPLVSIAPDLVDPVTNLTISQLLSDFNCRRSCR